MLPALRLAGDGRDHRFSDAISALAAEFHLTEAQLAERVPSGKQGRFSNRVGWAITDLKAARLLESRGRGTFKITPRGAALLREDPATLSRSFLKRYPEYTEFLARAKPRSKSEGTGDASETPTESADSAYNAIRQALVDTLLEKLRRSSPAQFEEIVLDVLVGMGYGGSREEAETVGRSGDGGIDGVIKEDPLGLGVIAVQAKRWDSPVPPKEVRGFVGSLDKKGARKGVFITTSTFSKQAQEEAEGLQNKTVALIDGHRLAELMIDRDVGVVTTQTITLKRVDEDYFSP